MEMKKKICVIMVLFVGFMFVSCNDEDYGILEHKKNGVVDLYATYSYLGENHNDFLTNVAGAIVGTVGSAVASAVTGDKITGKSVGKSAVSGALLASTGAVNKVANVLSKLFR